METIKRLCDHFGVPPHTFVYPEKISNPEQAFEFFADLRTWDNLHIAKLNIKGRERLRVYIEDLMKIDEYLKPSQDESR